MITKVFYNPDQIDWNKVVEIRKSSCYCLSLKTDLETYLEIEGHEDICVDSFIRDLFDECAVYGVTVTVKSQRLKRGEVDEA